jgi:DNA-binding CsgD family transcriptional regulator
VPGTSHKTLEGRLSQTQLEIVMHLANGLQIDEIADEIHRSPSNVAYHLGKARQRCHAKTLPHLVSIAIGAGALEWVSADATRKLRD